MARCVAADTWALGCTMLELLTGVRPWKHLGLTVLQLLKHISRSGQTPAVDERLGMAAKYAEGRVDGLCGAAPCRRLRREGCVDRPGAETARDAPTHPTSHAATAPGRHGHNGNSKGTRKDLTTAVE